MSREEAMRRHPSYQSRINWLVSDARREQADDVARRMLVEAEEHSGGPVVPESPEVRQERLDREACALASSNAAPRPKPESPVVAAAKAFGAGMAVFGTIWVMGLAGQFAGGWPL
ncbi:hypothetical protein [Dietzia cinnamea]|uniref:hypothetical protein n=1 Tax=Dietzia cinnamea TaxID=321318 RepID=UPI0021A97593|nr:hypothetical protein [Dietzia cinnamea]MCT2122565.1 hypothetical protein [Dietzia cinnamea]